MAEPAPLVSTPQAPIPPGAEAEWVRGAGAVQLRAAIFPPEGPVRGSVVLSSGRTEFIEKYYEAIQDFTERGFVVLAHDWRGQGLSARPLADRLKGHANGFKPYLDDYRALLAAFEERLPRPWIAVGHSMGGCLNLLTLAHGEKRFAGALLSAPMLGVNTGKVSLRGARFAVRMNLMFGRAERYVRGQNTDPFAADFDANVLTHDRKRFERVCELLAAEPQLALGGPTWGWLDFALKATAYLAKPDRLRQITLPVTIVQAEDERLVNNAAQDAAARHLPQGKLVRAPGAYHEILMETDPMRNILLRAFDALTGRAAPKPAAAPKLASAPVAPARVAPELMPAVPPPAAVAEPAPVAAGAPKPAAKPAARKPAAAKPATAKAATTKPPAKPAAPKTAAPKAAPRTAAAKTAAAKTAAAEPTATKAAAAAASTPRTAKRAPARRAPPKTPAA
jgi:lysophospholipase